MNSCHLKIDICEADNVTILTLVGALVIETHRSFTDDVKRLLSEGKNTILLNLEGVASIDSAGLGWLIWAYMEVCKAAGSLKLLRPSQCVQELFTRCRIVGSPRLEDFLEVHRSDAEAVASFKQRRNK